MSLSPLPGAAVILDAERARARAADLCTFIDAAPMPHHAAAECLARLEAAGYQSLQEGDAWSLEAGGRYAVCRGGSTVVAFQLGQASPADAGFAVVGAHLDSPNLRLKPNADRRSAGYQQLAVDVYGGPIIATWTDRDLGLAGRVVLSDDGGTETRLVTVSRRVARVANLAIHLSRKVNDEGLRLDKQRHLPAIVGLAGGDPLDDADVRTALADELGVDPVRILDYDLGLFDVTPSAIGGLRNEFVFAARLDNLESSHAALVALIESGDAPSDATRVIALWDHEECGSSSLQGAAGRALLESLERIVAAHPATTGAHAEARGRALSRSLLVSADMAHAVHPNYPEMHEPSHGPRMNYGPVIKRNDNQRYATDGETGARFRQFCRDAGFEPQVFVTRGDLPCGSTIGPISAARSGLPTVDVGNPTLSMHSIREMAGVFDHDLMVEALLRHFR